MPLCSSTNGLSSAGAAPVVGHGNRAMLQEVVAAMGGLRRGRRNGKQSIEQRVGPQPRVPSSERRRPLGDDAAIGTDAARLAGDRKHA